MPSGSFPPSSPRTSARISHKPARTSFPEISGSGCSRDESSDFTADLVEHASQLHSYADDFDVNVVDMFAEVIAFDDPDDDSVAGEVNFLIGYLTCAAAVLELEPAAMVDEYRDQEDDDVED